jgi:hypothetical protein
MRELLFIGAAMLAAVAAFVGLQRKTGGDCMPRMLLYGSAGAGLVTYTVLRLLF